jgi:hypothetical protein
LIVDLKLFFIGGITSFLKNKKSKSKFLVITYQKKKKIKVLSTLALSVQTGTISFDFELTYIQVCKHFLDAVEKKQYGWFWACPNGGKECHYRHALPPGYILKSQMKALLEEERDKIPIEEEIENQVIIIFDLLAFTFPFDCSSIYSIGFSFFFYYQFL